jgi:hypothetical protein
MERTLLEPETIALEIVQRLVSELENKDLRTLLQLPHRVILPGGEDALVRSDSGEHYYQQLWQGSEPPCHQSSQIIF